MLMEQPRLEDSRFEGQGSRFEGPVYFYSRIKANVRVDSNKKRGSSQGSKGGVAKISRVKARVRRGPRLARPHPWNTIISRVIWIFSRVILISTANFWWLYIHVLKKWTWWSMKKMVSVSLTITNFIQKIFDQGVFVGDFYKLIEHLLKYGFNWITQALKWVNVYKCEVSWIFRENPKDDTTNIWKSQPSLQVTAPATGTYPLFGEAKSGGGKNTPKKGVFCCCSTRC